MITGWLTYTVIVKSHYHTLLPGLWIPFIFADPDPAVLLNADKLPCEEFSGI